MISADRSSNLESIKYADLHIHTNCSDGSANPQEIVALAVYKRLQAIAITDHNLFWPSQIAIEYAHANELSIEVLRATELSTANGHLLIYDLNGEVKPGLDLEETLKIVHNLGGLAVVAHPGLPHISSIALKRIYEIIQSDNQELYFDGIETFNASGMRMQKFDRMQIVFGKSYQELIKFLVKNIGNPKIGALLGGSDSHTKSVGDAATGYFSDSIIDAIRKRECFAYIAQKGVLLDTYELFNMFYSILRYHLMKRFRE